MNSTTCRYIWPPGLPVSGLCGATTIEGTTRCSIHLLIEDPLAYPDSPPILSLDEPIFHSTADNIEDAMQTSPSEDADLNRRPSVQSLMSWRSGSTLADTDASQDGQATPDNSAAASPVIPRQRDELPLPGIPVLDHPGQGEECFICMVPLYTRSPDTQESELGIITPCGHLFGRYCLWMWLARSNTCPMCRAPLTVDFMIPDQGLDAANEHISVPLQTIGVPVGQGHEGDEEGGEDDAVDAGFIHGINPRLGFFVLRYYEHRLASGRYLATLLHSQDGSKQQLFIDDEETFQRGPWFPTHDIRRPVDLAGNYRIVTNLLDESQCWEIKEGSEYVRLFRQKLKVPKDVKFVVLTRRGKFLRWARSYEEWLSGF